MRGALSSVIITIINILIVSNFKFSPLVEFYK
jgi:hypothetical protein